MDDDNTISSFFLNPSRLSLAPIPTPLPRRRLSCQLTGVTTPAAAARKLPVWRLDGAEESTSVRSVGVGLGIDEAAAWEMFSAMERILVVAVMAVATKESKKGRTIAKLQRSVQIRDEVLLNMQKKLEDLCEQMNSSNCHQSTISAHKMCSESHGFGDSAKKEDDFCSCARLLTQLSPDSDGNLSNWGKDAVIDSSKNDFFKTGRVSMGEPEERRMSDLSDFSSVTSSVDIQLSSLAEQQDLYNLRKECEEKDGIINELSTVAHESNVAGSKRITELEEIIKRKSMIITRLKKDMVVLEQKVIQLTRQRRPSSTTAHMNSPNIPAMATNILYDMSGSSPSSSDSDTPVEHIDCQPQISVDTQSQSSTKSFAHSNSSVQKPLKHRSASPLKQTWVVSRFDSTGALRPKRLVSTSSVDNKRTRRHMQHESKIVAPQKRWV